MIKDLTKLLAILELKKRQSTDFEEFTNADRWTLKALKLGVLGSDEREERGEINCITDLFHPDRPFHNFGASKSVARRF